MRYLVGADVDRAGPLADVVGTDRAAKFADRVCVRASSAAPMTMPVSSLANSNSTLQGMQTAEEALELTTELVNLLEEVCVRPDRKVQHGLGKRARDR